MNITLQTPSVQYPTTCMVGPSLPFMEIFLTETLNRMLVEALPHRQQSLPNLLQVAREKVGESSKLVPSDSRAYPFDLATEAAWTMACEEGHPVLAFAILRLARRIRSATYALLDRWGNSLTPQNRDHIVAILDEQHLGRVDSSWYHIEGMHVTYAEEAGIPQVGQYIIAMGCKLSMVCALAPKDHDILHFLRQDSRDVLMQQMQTASIWMTRAPNFQTGMQTFEAQGTYKDIFG